MTIAVLYLLQLQRTSYLTNFSTHSDKIHNESKLFHGRTAIPEIVMLGLGSRGATDDTVGIISTSYVSRALSYAFLIVDLIFIALAMTCVPES